MASTGKKGAKFHGRVEGDRFGFFNRHFLVCSHGQGALDFVNAYQVECIILQGNRPVKEKPHWGLERR